MADTSQAIYIAGLKELRAALKAVEPGLQREMQRENKAFAARIVPRAQAAYNAVYPKPTSKQKRAGGGRRKGAVSQIRAVATQTSSGIRIGGARYRYMLGQEFGSNKYPQFRPWTGPGPSGRGSEGRYLYPTIRAEMPNVLRRYRSEVMDKVFAKAFPERRG